MKFKILRFLLNITAFFYVIFEEVFIFFSNLLNEFITRVPKLKDILDKVNLFLSNQHRYMILIVILLLLTISELLGLLAFAVLANGNIGQFIFLYIVKFLPFFVMSYVFKQTKEEMLKIKWFNFIYKKYILVIEYLKNTTVIKTMKDYKEKIKSAIWEN